MQFNLFMSLPLLIRCAWHVKVRFLLEDYKRIGFQEIVYHCNHGDFLTARISRLVNPLQSNLNKPPIFKPASDGVAEGRILRETGYLPLHYSIEDSTVWWLSLDGFYQKRRPC